MSIAPEQARDTVQQFESVDEPFYEISVSEAIRKLCQTESDAAATPHPEVVAELMAFGFCEDYQHSATGWGTYFGPFCVLPNAKGQMEESPSIQLVTPEMLAYWADRTEQVKHPKLRARYANLVWDFSKHVTGRGASLKFAHATMDANLALVASGHCQLAPEAHTKLRRALSLAISIGDHSRIEAGRDAILEYERGQGEDDAAGSWGLAFDALVDNEKVPLSAEQLRAILNDLEGRLRRTSGAEGEALLNPHAAEAAAIRLADYYRRHNALDDMRRVLLVFGQAYLTASESAAPFLAAAWARKVYDVYQSYGMRGEADDLSQRMRELSQKSADDMKTVSGTFGISREELEKYVDAMTRGDLAEVLTRIAGQFLPDPDKIMGQLEKRMKDAPLTMIIPRELVDDEGRSVARIGSFPEDRDGHMVRGMSESMSFSSIALRMVLEKALERHAPRTDDLVHYLYRSPAFDERKSEILARGLDAYLAGDTVVAIHLLVPQVEATLRRVLTLTGGAIYRPGRHGGLHLRNLDEILADPTVKKALTDRVVHYIRAVLTDARGWNVRNDVCHGMVNTGSFGWRVANQLLHLLLVLAQIQGKPKESSTADANGAVRAEPLGGVGGKTDALSVSAPNAT